MGVKLPDNSILRLQIPKNIRLIYKETNNAIFNDLSILSGIRAILEIEFDEDDF
jgi:hypothetical protein